MTTTWKNDLLDHGSASSNTNGDPRLCRSRGGGAPNIFRASGPNRNAVVLECLRLVRDHRCFVRTLAGKVFDRCEFSVVAEVLGGTADRLALAGRWEALFPHETAMTDSKKQYAAIPSLNLGTHFLEAIGPSADAAVDVLDLVSGEYNIAINVAFIRRGCRHSDGGRRYLVQLVMDLPAGRREASLARVLREWGARPRHRVRLISLLSPPRADDRLGGARFPRDPYLAPRQAAVAEPLVPGGPAKPSHRAIDFPGGPDLV